MPYIRCGRQYTSFHRCRIGWQQKKIVVSSPEEVYLLMFRLRKLREMTRERENNENTPSRPITLRSSHTHQLQSSFAAGCEKKREKDVLLARYAMYKRSSRLRESLPLSRPYFRQLSLICELYFNPTLSGPMVSQVPLLGHRSPHCTSCDTLEARGSTR